MVHREGERNTNARSSARPSAAGELSQFLAVFVLLWECSALLLSDPVTAFSLSRTPNPSQFKLALSHVIPVISPLFLPLLAASLGLRRCCSSAMLQPHAGNPVQGSDSLGRSEAICEPLNVRQTNGYLAGCPSGGVCYRGGSVYPTNRSLPRFLLSVYDGVLPKGDQWMWRQNVLYRGGN
jgi:hypothetical protein